MKTQHNLLSSMAAASAVLKVQCLKLKVKKEKIDLTIH
jgi:hypothetical protein